MGVRWWDTGWGESATCCGRGKLGCQGSESGWREELATDGLGDERTIELESESRYPAHDVVRDCGKHGPSAVGVEVTRRAVLEP